ncbi:MAG: hypothetical protein AB1798_17535, partial [Spirochaetota bacterium]
SSDRELFDTVGIPEEVHLRSIRAGLMLKKWVERENLSALSFNFLNVDQASGLETVPFLKASKLMAEGYGYAGEGDTLTAALVGALASGFPDTSFSEMFCPDWENNTIYLSHMGEVNYKLLAGKPKLIEMEYRFTNVKNPVLAAGRFKKGAVLITDLAPLPDNKYRLIIAPAQMIDIRGKDNMEKSVHGWFKPNLPIPDFLAEYSRLGGTHHLAISYNASLSAIKAFSRMMGWETVVLE